MREARRAQPDVCLVGQLLPGGGIEAVRQLSQAVPDAALVLLACRDDSEDLMAALRAGAVGYVPPGVKAAQLRRVVKAVLAREAAIPRSMVRDVLDALRAPEPPAGERLTGRQTQILAMLRRGESTARIAADLEISAVTVRRHISQLVQRTGVSDRRDLIAADAGARER